MTASDVLGIAAMGDRGGGVLMVSFHNTGELQHGRLAMIAIGGMIHGSFVTGTGVFGGAN